MMRRRFRRKVAITDELMEDINLPPKKVQYLRQRILHKSQILRISYIRTTREARKLLQCWRLPQ